MTENPPIAIGKIATKFLEPFSAEAGKALSSYLEKDGPNDENSAIRAIIEEAGRRAIGIKPTKASPMQVGALVEALVEMEKIDLQTQSRSVEAWTVALTELKKNHFDLIAKLKNLDEEALGDLEAGDPISFRTAKILFDMNLGQFEPPMKRHGYQMIVILVCLLTSLVVTVILMSVFSYPVGVWGGLGAFTILLALGIREVGKVDKFGFQPGTIMSRIAFDKNPIFRPNRIGDYVVRSLFPDSFIWKFFMIEPRLDQRAGLIHRVFDFIESIEGKK